MMKSLKLDIDATILIAVEEAINFISNSGLDVRINEAQLSPYLNDAWVATATLSSFDKEIVSQGLSIGGGNRQRARCLAIFEALERLYFRAFVNPHKISDSFKKSGLTFQNIFRLDNCSYYQLTNCKFTTLNSLNIDTLSGARPTSSSGWALGIDAWDACQRASNELIERDILKNIRKYSSLVVPINIKNFELGCALTQIALDLNYSLKTIVISLENSKWFALCCMYDPNTNKTFLGTSFGNVDQYSIINKSLEEVALGYYFAVIAGDKRIGLPADDFDYFGFSELYNSINSLQMHPHLPGLENNFDQLLFPLISNFTFRVFPVHNDSGVPKLFVAQAMTELEKVDVSTRTR